MKLPKKVYLAAAVLLFMGGAGTAVAFYPDSEPKKVVVEQVVSQEPQNEVQETVETPPAVTESVGDEPLEEQPKYGEYAPGVYGVFDKEAVMSEAGIGEADREVADAIIQSISGWVYKRSGNKINLCDAQPAEKMKLSGDDYLDNPVTQLKWCNEYVSKRHGSWQSAHEHFLGHRGI